MLIDRSNPIADVIMAVVLLEILHLVNIQSAPAIAVSGQLVTAPETAMTSDSSPMKKMRLPDFVIFCSALA